MINTEISGRIKNKKNWTISNQSSHVFKATNFFWFSFLLWNLDFQTSHRLFLSSSLVDRIAISSKNRIYFQENNMVAPYWSDYLCASVFNLTEPLNEILPFLFHHQHYIVKPAPSHFRIKSKLKPPLSQFHLWNISIYVICKVLWTFRRPYYFLSFCECKM